jgi:hypothetical protein
LLKELYMKRILIIVAAGLLAAGSLSAQAWGGRGNPVPGTYPQAELQAAETVKVDGKLALINGMIAVKSGTSTYYIGGLQGLIGFVDGLKEGAQVKLEGYAFAIPAAPEYQHLRVTKLTFNGKDYDLSDSFGRGMMGGPGAGRGGYNGNGQGGAMGGRGGRGGNNGGGRW